MTKKTLVIYSYLFLFVFTFALAFTFTSDTKAEGGNCCTISWCPYPAPPWESSIGHDSWDPKTGEYECIQTFNNPCDVVYTCQEN